VSSDGNATTSWYAESGGAYPSNPAITQQDLGVSGTGFVTGYVLNDISTAVLSIPSFVEYNDGIGSFSTAVGDFIDAAQKNSATRIIIDLQQNYGGLEALAFDTFRYFFPNQKTFAGSRMRAHYWANVLGSTLTEAFQQVNSSDDYYDTLVGEEWVVTDRINAQNGQAFRDWAEFYGPLAIHGDNFTLTERYNTSDVVFDEDFLGVDFPDNYTDNIQQPPGAWQPSSIVLLTDGICGSTCSLFVEMMVEAGVGTLAIGGRPEPGPMQATSGSRGAASYDATYLDYDFALAAWYNDNYSVDTSLEADYVSIRNNSGMQITQAGFTIRDQMRKNSTTPNQFLYLPADCRIYWSFANAWNYTRLWTDVWNATWEDHSLCIGGFANASTAGLAARSAEASSLSTYILSAIDPNNNGNPDSEGGIFDSPSAKTDIGLAPKHLVCAGGSSGTAYCQKTWVGSVCKTVSYSCGTSGDVCVDKNCQKGPRQVNVCAKSSTNSGSQCSSNTLFKPTARVNTKANYKGAVLWTGDCVPKPTQNGDQCTLAS
jgi:hypothetical protein